MLKIWEGNHNTKYFMTSPTFCLFNILSTSHSLTSSTSTGFTSSFFCPPTCSLYHTIWLTFTTRWILINIDSHNLTTLVDTTSLIIYGPIYQSTSFLASCSLNTKFFVLNISLSPTFHTLAFFFLLFAYLFIFSCAFINTALVSSCKFHCFFHLSFSPQIYTHSQLSSIVCYEWRHFDCWMYLVIYYKLCWC